MQVKTKITKLDCDFFLSIYEHKIDLIDYLAHFSAQQAPGHSPTQNYPEHGQARGSNLNIIIILVTIASGCHSKLNRSRNRQTGQ